MPRLNKLNEESYHQLNERANFRVDCQSLCFTRLGSAESFEFLFNEWVKHHNVKLSKLTDDQTALIAILRRKENVLIPKDRQVGETLAICIYLANEIYYNNKTVFILAPNQHYGALILERVKWFLNSLIIRNHIVSPKVPCYGGNRNHIIRLGITCLTVITNRTELRGSGKCDIIYMAEAAFISNADEIYESILFFPAHFIIASSFNGQDNFFAPLLETAPQDWFTIFPMRNTIDSRNDPDNWPNP